MEIRFWEEISFPNKKYTGLTDLGECVEHCRRIWKEHLRQEWVHRFIHTLEIVPRTWYTSKELQRGTIEWERLFVRFTQTFKFVSEHPTMDVALQVIKEKVFEEILIADTHFHQCTMTTHRWMQ